MTPAQQAALEALAGRALSADEQAEIDALLTGRDDVRIAAVLNAGQPPKLKSLRVEEVFDTLFSTGDYMTMKMAQLEGNPLAGMIFAVLADAKTLGPGLVDLQSPVTAELLNQLQSAALLSPTGRAALAARSAESPAPIHYNAVSDALNVAEGRMTL